jgi:hypothetical protein
MRLFTIAVLTLGVGLVAWADEPKKDKAPEPDKKMQDKAPEKIPEPKVPGKADEPQPPAAEEFGPPVEIILVPGEASAVPVRKGVAFADGAITNVEQLNPTTLVITMSGLVAANSDLCRTSVASYRFDLTQAFELHFHGKTKTAKLTLDGRVIGLLVSDHSHYVGCLGPKGGTAETEPAHAAVSSCDHNELVSVTLPARETSCGHDLAVYNYEGPHMVSLPAGKYVLSENWGISVSHPPFYVRGASAEFAPQPNYNTENHWLTLIHPFNGQATKDFGFKVTLKVVAE